MKVALTGATGFVGSHVLTALQKSGHDVMALVRNDAQAETVAAAGAMPAVVDLYDRSAVVRLLNDAEGAIHDPRHIATAPGFQPRTSTPAPHS